MSAHTPHQSTKNEKQATLTEHYRSKFLGPPVTRTEKNIRALVSKQLIEASKQTKHGGRLVISNTQVHTVRICGMITNIDQQESHTDFLIYDGTGSIEGRIWQNNNDGKTDLSGASLQDYYIVVANVVEDRGEIKLQTLKARKVFDYNNVVLHMLEVIHEHCMLSQLGHATVSRWPEAMESSSKIVNTKFAEELNKEAVVGFLHNPKRSESSAGATSEEIMRELQIDSETVRTTLASMLDEGSVYNTIDYNHFKLTYDS